MNILLAINWSAVGVQAGYLLLALSLLVILHEFGHYLPAKLFGCRVEKFFLFFDPYFALVKKKIGDTVYGIGWLPLGGYVKIAGMVDESMDKEALAKPPEPWEFRSKPAWQRLIIMIGGVTVNVIVAFLIYAMILLVWGEQKLPMANVKQGISITDSFMYDLGFRDGDQLVAVDGKPVNYFDDAAKRLLVADGSATIVRDGREQTLNMPKDLLGKLVEKKRSKTPLFIPRTPVVVSEVSKGSNAAKAGLAAKDEIVEVNGQPTPNFESFKAQTNVAKGQTVAVVVRRGEVLQSLPVVVAADGTLGFMRADFMELSKLGYLKMEEKNYNVFTAIPAGMVMAWDNLVFYVDQFKKILSPETGAYKGVGGFKSMGSIFPEQWGDWETFWRITAFLSIVLAFMNLLPIPALDGGHVLFLLYEMITRRRPSEKFLEYAQIAGMVILFGLMLYANGNDWLGWGRNK